MPNYALEKNFLYLGTANLKNKLLELSTTLGFAPIAQYQSSGDEYFVWEFDTLVGRKAYYQCQLSSNYFYWRYGSAWESATKLLDGQVSGSSFPLTSNSLIDVCIVKNVDLFGIFITTNNQHYSSLILLPQVFDAGMWSGLDLYFGNSSPQSPNQFVAGKLNKFSQNQSFSLSYCGDFVFSLPNLAGNIPVLSGLFLIAPSGEGILAGFSENTGICASSFLKRFSEIPDMNTEDKWLTLYRSNGGLAIKI